MENANLLGAIHTLLTIKELLERNDLTKEEICDEIAKVFAAKGWLNT